jgi:Flp pilus assembly protein TadG
LGRDDGAQVLPVVAIFLLVLLGMAGLVIDVGHVYYSFRELQASSDAAALAGAQSLPSTSATTMATSYSSLSGKLNAYDNLPNVTMVSGYPLLKCLTTLTKQGIACVAPANANAIMVKQQFAVPMYFASLFGTKTVTITASATASMRGSNPSPYNVAIVIDATPSMNSIDGDSNCNSSRITCALSGVQTLLNSLSPCGASVSSCGTVDSTGNVTNSVDRVSVFSFPNVTTSTVGNDYDCKSGSPTSSKYTYPSTTASSYDPSSYNNLTYQVLDFQSDYRTSDTSASLNSGSNLTISVGGKSGCTGIQTPGSQDTYYAGVIYAAQAALLAEKAANPGSQNVLIFLSDGDSNAPSKYMSASGLTANGVYPSLKNQCHQAITAAQAATAAGTTVYSVAYGSAAGGCSTDSPTITACQTMQQMASSSSTFFSDYTATGSTGNCISAAQPTTNLSQIFTQIAGDLTHARLIPDSVT